MSSQFSVGVGAGLNASAPAIAANSTGTVNATRGSAAAHGGDASDSTYGEKAGSPLPGVSLSAGMSASWSAPLSFAPSPTAAGPGGWKDADLAYVPGNPLAEAGRGCGAGGCGVGRCGGGAAEPGRCQR